MPCQVSDISIDVTAPPGPDIPGFGPPFSPIQIPLPDLDLPTDLVEDLLALMQQLGALFPSGLFKANLDGSMKDVLDFIASILSQISPFLSFYNFIMALLNLIVCIIEVLCAIPNPFAVASKLKRLFAECLPAFLNIFPWLALLAMILALILLILALIEYIINTILAMIEQIIRNIIILTEGLTLQDSEAVLAAAEKIASLLCLMEGLFAILIAIAAIIAVIQALASFAGLAICDEGDESGCCAAEICPDFIRLNNEINALGGTLVYYNKIGPDLSASGLPPSLLSLLGGNITLRQERWQLYDETVDPEFPINGIIIPTVPIFFGGSIFYPDQEFAADTAPSRAPYTVDMTMFFDPKVFNSSLGDPRTFFIKDCIVIRKPINGLRSYNNIITSGFGSGTFDLEGGLVFEEDQETPVQLNGTQLTLNEFIHEPDVIAIDLPTSDDGYVISDINFVWKPIHPTLAGFNLITVGCFPEVTIEKAVQNSIILAEGIEPIIDRVPDLSTLTDDLLSTLECSQAAINKFRSGINLETVEVFRTEVIDCLTDLQVKVNTIFCDSFSEAVSIFKSTFSIDTDIQFTTRPITTTVILRDAGGTNIGGNLPDECLEELLGDGYNAKLVGSVTFGEITSFEYNKADLSFTAVITSDAPGSGELTVSYEGQDFNTLVAGVDFDNPSSIEQQISAYEFIADIDEEAVRRGPEDVSGG